MVGFPELTKSRLRRKLLGYFFAHPQDNVYVREAAAILDEDAGNLSKELSRLEDLGIFISSNRGKEKYFSLNKEYPLYEELKSVVSKTIGVEGSLKEAMEKFEGIKIAFIYGSFAQGKDNSLSDIDILVIGNPDKDKLMEKIELLEKKFKREVNYNIYSEKELKARLDGKDSFILNIIKRPKIMLKGRV